MDIRRDINRIAGAVGLIAVSIPSHATFALLSSALYARFTWCHFTWKAHSTRNIAPERALATITFAFISVTSIMALATDRALVGSGGEFALLFSLGIFLLAGVTQFVLFHRALAESVIVTARFQTLTAQSAHLKNTSYFLLIVVLFWLPSFHSIMTLSREARVRPHRLGDE